MMDTLTTSARPVAKVPGCLTTQTVSLLSLPCIYSSQTSKCYSLLSSDDTVFALSSGHGKCGRYQETYWAIVFLFFSKVINFYVKTFCETK